MDMILIKILAAFLALSQVTTRPDAIKTEFDPTRDTAEVTQILRDGCGHMRKAFDVESIDVDDLIKTAMDDPGAFTAEIKSFHGLKFESLILVYRQFCKNEDVKDSPVDIGEVIRFYDQAVAGLPDATALKGMRGAGAGGVIDGKGERFADLSESNRRIWVPLKDIPVHVQKAFIAAEDKRFYEHKGVDERGLIRAMISNLARSGRPQGGSTITQQVVKNLLVGDDVTYERKMREVIVASRVEHSLTKAEILETYLNSIYLGRGAYGIELAARTYFGKPAAALSVTEGATLAGLTKGPTYYSPDRHPDRAQERLAYVLSRMQEDAGPDAAALDAGKSALPHMVAYDRAAQRDSGYYFLDHVSREARSLANIPSLATAGLTVRTTIRPDLQHAAEAALQEGLAQYEMRSGRVEWRRAETNLGEAVRRIEGAGGPKGKPAWQQALAAAHLPLYDVHWDPAVVLGTGSDRSGLRVGLTDGRVVPLSAMVRRGISTYDVVFVKLTDAKGKGARAELRVRPTVQGAAIILDNKTGGILAMAGGFSYPLSQLNRTTQSQRQPGSSIKPFTYLAALRHGLQPNTLVRDQQITLPPIGNSYNARERDYWTPKNADGDGGGITTLRRGLENSKNLVTANLLDGGIDADPSQSLARVCELTLDAQIYTQCVAYYPFVLGAQPARLIDMAAFYAAVATEGRRPAPYGIESIEQNGRQVYSHKPEFKWLASGDRPAFFQLRTMLQGVVARGTARVISQLSPYVGGKTGTSDDANDAWFVGFTNDVTVGVWVGYDNSDGRRRTLGGSQTGGKVAVPIFEQIVQAAWAHYARQTPLNPPSPEAKKELVALPIDLASGTRVNDRRPQAFTEYFRLRNGHFDDTQYNIVSQDEVGTPDAGYASGYGSGYADGGRDSGRAYYPNGYPGQGNRSYYGNGGGGVLGGFFGLFGGGGQTYAPQQQQQQRPVYPPAAQPGTGGLFGELRSRPSEERRFVAPRRVDPDYPNRGQRYY
jgi:penicillin-binding protein 1A